MSDSRLNDLLDFLRFPSISTQSEHAIDLRNCAEWLRQKIESLGMTAEVRETGGHPAVIGRTPHDPAKRTLLIYGHYDVQPPEPLELWETPPFEPSIRNDRIYARGSTDNKGQILAHVLGVGEAIASGKPLPVNVIFLIEGEEEIGSDHLAPFLERYKEDLACDVIVIFDTGMAAHGYPTLTYALRGISALEFKASGPALDLHSGVFGGAVMNPATAVARLIASLHDEDGRVAIPGFYDAVADLLPWERDAAAALPIGDESIRELTGVSELFGEKGYNSIERIGGRPTAEVNGIGGGYQGEGTKTVLPREAFAKLTFRLVPNQQPEEILRLAEAHLVSHCPPGIKLEITKGHSGEPYFADPTSPDGLAVQRALERVFGHKPALMREGGSIPIVVAFRNILGPAALLPGLASPDCQAHSPNENFPIENFYNGIKLSQAILEELGTIPLR